MRNLYRGKWVFPEAIFLRACGKCLGKIPAENGVVKYFILRPRLDKVWKVKEVFRVGFAQISRYKTHRILRWNPGLFDR